MNKHNVKVTENGAIPEWDNLTGKARIPVPRMVATATKVALINANVSVGKLKWRRQRWDNGIVRRI
tara:strand:- start:44 stop:241 length:198 start_codon:yes stop_codon:yes gene_type:complete